MGVRQAIHRLRMWCAKWNVRKTCTGALPHVLDVTLTTVIFSLVRLSPPVFIAVLPVFVKTLFRVGTHISYTQCASAFCMQVEYFLVIHLISKSSAPPSLSLRPQNVKPTCCTNTTRPVIQSLYVSNHPRSRYNTLYCLQVAIITPSHLPPSRPHRRLLA